MKRAAFLTAYLAVLVALLPGAGGAVPSSTAAPTISGTATEGSVLTLATGTWTGSGTITYTYQWLRCGYAGSPCTVIAGATAATYTLTAADVGSTLRAVVTAKDSAGTNSATASPTARVTGLAPAGAVTLSDGKVAIPPTSVTAPHRIVIDAVEAPALVRPGATATVRIRVSDTRGYVVQALEVEATSLLDARGLPIKKVVSGADGWATLKATAAKPKRGSFLLLSVSASYWPPGAKKDEEGAVPLLYAERIVKIPLGAALKTV